MSRAKHIEILESLEELKRLQKKSKSLFLPRIRMLIEMKKSPIDLSKRALSDLIGVDPNSIQNWRDLYLKGGIILLLSHKKTGFKPSVFEPSIHEALKEKLSEPNNGIRGYTELLHWLKEEFNKDYEYSTLIKYCVRNFGSKIKVARKSHIKKDVLAVELLKKL